MPRLEDTEEAFNGIGTGIASHVLILAVIDGQVLGVVLGDLAIHTGFVSREARIRGDVLADRFLDAVEHLAGDVDGASLPVSLNQREHLFLVTPAATRAPEGLAAKVGFVRFHHSPIRSQLARGGVLASPSEYGAP
jgi:hypothetical protein